jgi:signal transduction histidine kinase/tetratricopeptide (TPR) repeat protein
MPQVTLFGFFISGFILLSQHTAAQSNAIDSLAQAVTQATGRERVKALNALAFRLILVNIPKSDSVSQITLALARELDDPEGGTEALIYKGMAENMTGQRQTGLPKVKAGIQAARDLKRSDLQGYAQVQLGNFYRNEGRFDSALFWYESARGTLQDSAHPWQLSVLYRNLARYYNLRAQPREEIRYLQRAWRIREKLEDRVLKADILVLLSQWYLFQADLPQAKIFLEKAMRVGVDPSIVEIQKTIDYQHATILFSESKYKEALRLLYDVQNFYQQNGNESQYVRLQLDLAEMLEEMGNFDISLKNGLEALHTAERNQFLTERARALLIIGRNYYRIRQLPTAHEYAQQALQLAQERGYKNEEATALNFEGLLLKAEGRLPEALERFKQALSLRESLNQPKGIGSTLGNIGETYEAMGRLQDALEAQLASLTIKEEILHQSGLAWAYFDLGSVYTKLKDYPRALSYLEKAEAKSRQTKSGVVLVNVYKTRRDLYESTGDLRQALRYSRLYEELKDSVNSSAIANRVLGLQSAYELDRQAREIELLSKDKQVQRDQLLLQAGRIRQQRLVIASVVTGLILLGGLVYSLYRFNRRKDAVNRQLSLQNEEIQKQSRELHVANATLNELNQQLSDKQEQILKQATRLDETNKSLILLNKELAEKTEELAAQSEELRESNDVISHLNQNLENKVLQRTEQLQQAYQELDTFFYRSSHDFRRPLTTFMGLAEVAKITVKDQAALELFQKVKETATSLDRMLTKLQSISNVGSEQQVAKAISVHSYLENVCHIRQAEIEAAGIQVLIQSNLHEEIVTFPGLLHIVLENLVENAIQFRSRQAPKLLLSSLAAEGGVLIRVSDNGMGLDEMYVPRVFDMFFRGHEQSKGNGLGLYIVKKAVDKLGGRVQFISKPQLGSEVSVWLPARVTGT